MKQGIVCDISCDVCRDLIPLVVDGVASGDSETLVREHTARCEACRAYMQEGGPVDLPSPDDAKILHRLKRRMTVSALVFAVIGAVLCLALRFSVYLMWWMPVLGMLSYVLARKRWWLVPVGVGALAFVGNLGWNIVEYVRYGAGSTLLLQSLSWMLQSSVGLSLQYLVLVALGVLVAALLRFAFGGLHLRRRKGKEEQP